MLLVCLALVLPAVSGCAMAVRAFAAIQVIDAVGDLTDDAPGRNPVVARTGGSTPLATITGTGGSGLRLNGRPGGDRLDVLPDGTGVTVRCRIEGPERDGPFGPTADWFQVVVPGGGEGFMSGAYLDLDTGPAAVPSCPAPGQPS